MLFALVHRIDVNLVASVEWREMLQNAGKAEGKSEDEEGEAAKGSIDTVEDRYIDAFANIVACLCITVSYATVVKLLSLLLGPLQWKHVTALYAIQMVSAAVSKRRPAEPFIMIAILLIMPGVISGSLTRLLGTLFCLGTIGWPLGIHTLENISDRTEVCWVLISMLLDLVHFGTAALICQANDFGLKSIGLIVSSLCWGMRDIIPGSSRHIQRWALGRIFQENLPFAAVSDVVHSVRCANIIVPSQSIRALFVCCLVRHKLTLQPSVSPRHFAQHKFIKQHSLCTRRELICISKVTRRGNSPPAPGSKSMAFPEA